MAVWRAWHVFIAPVQQSLDGEQWWNGVLLFLDDNGGMA
jgi:hypothetical protein